MKCLVLTSFIMTTVLSQISIADVNLPDSNNLATIEDYLNFASSTSAEMQAAYEEWKAASEEIPQSKALPDPQIKYGYATERTPTQSVFEVMQEFPWFGTIKSRTNAATALSNAAYKKYEAKRLEILKELKRWFYEYCFLYKSISITTENTNLARQLEKVVREKYATTITEHPDIIKAQIILATMEYNIQTLNAYRQPLVMKLNSILNRPPIAELGWPKRPEFKPVSLNFNTIYSLVMQNNPDLKALGYDIDAARSSRKLAEKKFYPNLGLGIAIDAGMGRDGETRYMPLVSINIPLWRDSYKAGERQAQALVNQAAKEKEQKQNDLAAAAQQSLYEFEDSLRRTHLYGDILIPKSKEHFISSQNAYQAGTIDFMALLDSLQNLYNYQLLYERALADNAQKLAELEALTGIDLSKEFEQKTSANPERNIK